MVSNLELAITAVGAAGAIIAIYKFVLMRPSLVLEFSLTSKEKSLETPIYGGKAHLTPVFYLKNSGRKFAEDPYLEIELEGWNFNQTDVSSEPDTPQLGDSAKDSVDNDANTQTLDLTLSEKCVLHGRDLEDFIDIPPTVLGSAVIWDSSNPPRPTVSDNTQYPETHLQLKNEELTTRIAAPGEIRKLSIENAIYPGSEFKLYYGGVELPVNHRYVIRYTVACRDHRPRNGWIILSIDEDGVEIQELRSDDWSLRQRRKLNQIVRVLRRESKPITAKVY